MSNIKKLVITGGHHTSAMPVIHELKEQYPEIRIYWIGHKYSMKGDKNPTLEYQEISALQIPFYNLSAGKVYRTLDAGRLLKVPVGFFQALFLLMKIRPDRILSFGGYLAAPVVLAGWFLGIPSITHEQTVVAGYANRFISGFAKKVLISWPTSAKYFPAAKTVFVGLPVRQAVFEKSSSSFNSDNFLPTIYVTAGKTGSHKINEIMYESLPELLEFTNVIHQCGDHSQFQDYDKLFDKYSSIKKDKTLPGTFYLRKFVLENEIGEAYSRSDIVVSRSGAHVTVELLALEKPCILIPIPWASHNEQFENAMLLVESGLGVLLEEKHLNKELFLTNVRNILSDLDKYKIKDPSKKQVVSLNASSEILRQTLS